MNKIVVFLICINLIFLQGCSTIKYVKEHPYKALGKITVATLIVCGAAAQAYSKSNNQTSSATYQPVYQPASTSIKTSAYSVPRKIVSVGGGNYTANSIGKFDYVNGSNGYSGSGQQIGKFYYYNDNQGNNYTTQSIGKFDYTSGPNGYSGTGQKIGNFYYYNDNK